MAYPPIPTLDENGWFEGEKVNQGIDTRLQQKVDTAAAPLVGRVEDAEAAATTAATTAATLVPRMTSVENSVGLGVGDPADATNANLIGREDTETRTALNAATADMLHASKEPTGSVETLAGKASVTNHKTGERTPLAGAVTDIRQAGAGARAKVDGLERWVSPSGYPRNPTTIFRNASLLGSSSAANLGPELAAALAPLGINVQYLTTSAGGYQISHIAAAAGVRPLEASAFTIPASGPVTITPTNMPEANNAAVPVSWPGTFAGIPGDLKSSAGSPDWIFTRHYAGTATSVPAGTPFIPLRPYQYQDGLGLLNVGKNTLTDNTHMSYDEVVSLTEKMFDFYAGVGRHVLVIGHYQAEPWVKGSGGFERIEAYNNWARARYGARFVDVQAYLDSAQVWVDTGLTPTAADLTAQTYPQTLPPSLQKDSMHLSDAGDAAVAALIAGRVQELNWTGTYEYPLSGVPAPAVTWRADMLAGDNTTPQGSWQAASGAKLLYTSQQPKPVAGNDGADRYLTHRRTDRGLEDTTWQPYGTVIALTRIREFEDLTLIINMGMVTIARHSSGNLTLSAGANVTTPMPLNTWGVVSAVIDGANSRLGWGSTVVSGNAGTNAPTAFSLSRLNDYGVTDYAAVLVWAEKLTEPQVQTVVNALRAAHPDLI